MAFALLAHTMQTYNGVTGSAYLHGRDKSEIFRCAPHVHQNCSEGAFEPAQHRLAATAGSLEDGFVSTVLVNAFHL